MPVLPAFNDRQLELGPVSELDHEALVVRQDTLVLERPGVVYLGNVEVFAIDVGGRDRISPINQQLLEVGLEDPLGVDSWWGTNRQFTVSDPCGDAGIPVVVVGVEDRDINVRKLLSKFLGDVLGSSFGATRRSANGLGAKSGVVFSDVLDKNVVLHGCLLIGALLSAIIRQSGSLVKGHKELIHAVL